MKKTILIAIAVTAIGSITIGCSFSVGTGSNTASPTPAAANKSTSNTNTGSTSKTDSKPKPKLTNETKPTDGKAVTANKKNAVPDNWIYVYDSGKGYGFYLPEGSEGESQTVDGIDVFAATTPAPSEIDIFVLAYKDKTLTKEDLLNDAVEFLEGLGQKVTPGALKAESDEYAVADATTVHPSRGKGKLRILVGTDVTDNYVMILGTEEGRFAANEKIIDEIWGSFEMWSQN
ncbi:MAG TPA: hypothetical protein PKM58_01910 [Pyrinomonadaceae bacterium]|nr:hypothetical protein [Pyrinomonadaceae bacterium]